MNTANDPTAAEPGDWAEGPPPAPPGRRWLELRRPIPAWQAILASIGCVIAVLLLWQWATSGDAEKRIISYQALPSPRETFSSWQSLWYDRALTRNTLTSLRRVALGFGLAVAVGVPLGVLCGCYTWASAFFAPLTIFGRNIPIAALIPLTFSLFGIGEAQKVMFIFIACVAFVISDTAHAVAEVGSHYIDTAYTLGASRLQVVLKVLVPLALPHVFNSLRVLFGLAFGYIMLAEVIKLGGETGGLGDIIITSQRRGPKEHVLLVLLIIPVVALAIDSLLYWIQRELFPHRYGGSGLLARLVRATINRWEDAKSLVMRPVDASIYTSRRNNGPPAKP